MTETNTNKIDVKFSVSLQCTVCQLNNEPYETKDVQFNLQFAGKGSTQTPFVSEWIAQNDEDSPVDTNNSISSEQVPFQTEYDISFTKQQVIDWRTQGKFLINATLKSTITPPEDETSEAANDTESQKAKKNKNKKDKNAKGKNNNNNEKIDQLKTPITIDLTPLLTGITTINQTINYPNYDENIFRLSINVNLDQPIITKEWNDELIPFDLEISKIENLPLPYQFDSSENAKYKYKPMFLSFQLPGMKEPIQTETYTIDYASHVTNVVEKHNTHKEELITTIKDGKGLISTLTKTISDKPKPSKFALPNEQDPIAHVPITFRKIFLLGIELDNVNEFLAKITSEPIHVNIYNQTFTERQSIKDPHALLKEYQKKLTEKQANENNDDQEKESEKEKGKGKEKEKEKDNTSKKKGKTSASKKGKSNDNKPVFDETNSTDWYIHGQASFILTDLFSTSLTKIPTVSSCRLVQTENIIAKFHDKIPILKVDDYNRYQSQITIKYQLLSSFNKLTTILDETKPYVRRIYCYRYKDNEITHKLRDFIGVNNLKALGKEDEPNIKALVNIQLTPEQKIELDIITGFQVIDDNWRMVVVEGKRNGEAMKQLADLIPKFSSLSCLVSFDFYFRALKQTLHKSKNTKTQIESKMKIESF